MIPDWVLWHQKTVVLTKDCNLRCIDCLCWQQKDKTTESTEIKTTLIPQLVNVVGGESLNDEKLLLKLKQLKKHGKYIRLWTNGVQLPNFWAKLSPYVDDVMLYCPSHHPEGYRHITGDDHFKELSHAIQCIYEDPNVTLNLNVPIKPYTVPYMQDLYDTFYAFKPYYFFHYNAYDQFENESIDYIKRFLNVPNCFVLKKSLKESNVCEGYPFGIKNTLLETPAHMLEWSHKLNQKWGPTSFFRKVLK